MMELEINTTREAWVVFLSKFNITSTSSFQIPKVGSLQLNELLNSLLPPTPLLRCTKLFFNRCIWYVLDAYEALWKMMRENILKKIIFEQSGKYYSKTSGLFKNTLIIRFGMPKELYGIWYLWSFTGLAFVFEKIWIY